MHKVKCLKCKKKTAESNLLETGLCPACLRQIHKDEPSALFSYSFTITVGGIGRDRETAWADAIDGLYVDPGENPSLEETKYEGSV